MHYPIYSASSEVPSDVALNLFECRKNDFMAIKQQLDAIYPPEQLLEPVYHCDLEEDESDEKVAVGDIVLDGKLRQQFEHNLKWYGCYRRNPPQHEDVHYDY